MVEKRNSRQGPGAEESADLKARRRILKAGLGATLITTLPSGRAIANASVYQCVIKDRERSDNLTEGEGGDWIPPDADEWLRVEAQYISFRYPDNGGGAVREAYLLATGQYFVGDTWDDSRNPPNPGPGSQLDGNLLGTEFTLTELNATSDPNDTTVYWVEKNSERRNVLALFMDAGDPPGHEGVYFAGVYPNEQRIDNMGITESCLCSVDAGVAEDTGLPFC